MKGNWKKQLFAGALAVSLFATGGFTALAGDYTAAPDGKTNAADLAAAMGNTSEWESWVEEWNTVKTDWTQISLTPGSDATQLNFAWYTPKNMKTASSGAVAKIVAKVCPKLAESTMPKMVIGEGKNMRHAKVYEAVQTSVEDEKDNDGNEYNSNKVTVTGLKENTTYYYSYDNGNGYTEPAAYTTKSTDKFSFVFVGDPQIGSSNELKGTDSEKFYNAQSDSVRSDSFNWEATLEAAMAKTGNQASFVVSAGDQIQTTKKKSPNKDASKSEIEYTGYLSPDVLKSLPVATTVGNHDADNANYTYHFNTPNSSELGSNGIVGGDYYFTYGDVLFMMLNTQDTNVAEHKQFIEQATAANSDCKWRIVTLHQDIYGSAEHSNEPEITNLRYQLAPYFEEYDVDAVLTGHDHAYSRSRMLLGGTATSDYTDDEFDEMLERDMDTKGDKETQLFTAPGNIQDDTEDPEEKAYLEYLYSVMDANAVEELKDDDVAYNPEGILYMTANSSSGSKYYDLVPRMQTYIAGRWQEDVPTYSIIDVTDHTLTINTYRTDNGEKIDDTFTIVKSDAVPGKAAAAAKAVGKKKVMVSITPVKNASGYEIQYADNSCFKKAVTKKTTKTTCIFNAPKKGTCYIRVRAYKKVSGKTIYGAYSDTVRVTLK
ncbi:MAG: metallophosphoesterase family protein [Lachnospiraceae bacterium]|nr:metallophosphoesterase family protein [Lachnospiraceae bacterium]